MRIKSQPRGSHVLQHIWPGKLQKQIFELKPAKRKHKGLSFCMRQSHLDIGNKFTTLPHYNDKLKYMSSVQWYSHYVRYKHYRMLIVWKSNKLTGGFPFGSISNLGTHISSLTNSQSIRALYDGWAMVGITHSYYITFTCQGVKTIPQN